ncbi:MAG: hypothetical protein KBF43_15270 [Dermatophilaceae bacterium]|nr:hypothetical protein [Dermatophilaceae bacterium]MBP9919943.1 hypothetical protein [Dermatophilaceae bacterium]
MGSDFPAAQERTLARRVTGDNSMPTRPASAVVGVGLGLVAVATLPTAYAIPGAAQVRRLAGSALLARAIVLRRLLLKGFQPEVVTPASSSVSDPDRHANRVSGETVGMTQTA